LYYKDADVLYAETDTLIAEERHLYDSCGSGDFNLHRVTSVKMVEAINKDLPDQLPLAEIAGGVTLDRLAWKETEQASGSQGMLTGA